MKREREGNGFALFFFCLKGDERSEKEMTKFVKSDI